MKEHYFFWRWNKKYGRIKAIAEMLSELKGGYLGYITAQPRQVQKEWFQRIGRQIKARYDTAVTLNEVRKARQLMEEGKTEEALKKLEQIVEDEQPKDQQEDYDSTRD